MSDISDIFCNVFMQLAAAGGQVAAAAEKSAILTPRERIWGIAGAMGLATIVSYVAGFAVIKMGRKLRIMDNPVERSSHKVPTPRTGGVAILIGIMVGLSLLVKPTAAFAAAAIVGAAITLISFLDDIITISSLPRLILHFLVAGLTIHMIGLQLPDFGIPYLTISLPKLVGFVISVVFVVGFVNFFNFMDGINGISASQGIWGGLTLAVLLAWGKVDNSVLIGAAIAGGCLGFMPHNFPNARVFMGDIGSTTIGFILAMLTLVGACRAQIDGVHLPWIACIMPLGVFLYDATFTLFKRVIRGENFLKAHREHHYQLLVRCGWSHAKVTSVQMALMTACSLASLIYVASGDAVRLALIALLLTMFGTYSIVVHRYFATHRKDEVTCEAPCEASGEAPGEASGAPSGVVADDSNKNAE